MKSLFCSPDSQRAARHLRWLARRVVERQAECAAEPIGAPPMRHDDVLWPLLPLRHGAKLQADPTGGVQLHLTLETHRAARHLEWRTVLAR